MVAFRVGNEHDAERLTPLVFSSAPELLSFIFGSEIAALKYLHKALMQSDGQYSAHRHCVAVEGDAVVGCMSLWHSDMPKAFHQATVNSLAKYLSVEQLSHIVGTNDILATVFTAPAYNQLCMGHLAVDKSYQRKQIGSKLLVYALEELQRLGKQQLVLDVDCNNQRAISFYQKWQFVPFKESVFLPTGQRFLRMQHTLC